MLRDCTENKEAQPYISSIRNSAIGDAVHRVEVLAESTTE